ncbi:glycerophosphoryl diester phosphodiesterase membrane domain-containing protein [Natrononativus amylolyticus]|uniref:glycerophosphoryl diester phosphodiesterase membrane domain-containing protein n=1 Tax=Natrononativus amylolyticus TaxID=2963434 RepID=UPI0020CFBD0E|nr:glycerophosphoryl diester phosphodiesterase membrane domain-containing protein [Natrononativus amylolyticus]
MNVTVDRKNAVGTVTEAAGWLVRNPALIAAFFVLGVVQAAGEEFFLLSLFGWFLSLYLGGIAYVYARDELAGADPDLNEASSQVLPRILSLVGIFFAYGIAVFVGLLLLIIPGIYLSLRLVLAFPACVLDDKRAIESLKTSWRVAHGNLLKLLGISILMFVVSLSAIVVTALFTGLGDEFLVGLLAVTAVLTAFLTPIVEMAYARIYLENREPDDGESDDDWDRDDGDAWDRDEDDSWDRNEDDSWDRDDDWGTSDDETDWSTDDRDDRDESRW